MKLIVGIATVGRSDLVRQLVARLQSQSRAPDGIIVVGAEEKDIATLRGLSGVVVALASQRGLCVQRNHILALLPSTADLIVFFDDDFVPKADYLEGVRRLFERRSDVVGATGRIVADGIKTAGYSLSDATALNDADRTPANAREDPAEALYGCNMVLRCSALAGLRFDEALPLYGWLEDIDLTYRLARKGPLIRSGHFAGVHMGAKGGRTSGLKLGYSQIANPVYMLGKRSTPRDLAFRMMSRNLAANILRSLWPEPHVDRRGRLRGNLLALLHLATCRLHPRHVLSLR